MRNEDGGGKMASRGVSRRDNYLSWDAYKDAVYRPRRFQELLDHFGVRVTGRGRLAWLSAQTSQGSPSSSASTSSDSGAEVGAAAEEAAEEGGEVWESRQPLSQQPLFTYSPRPAALGRSRSAPQPPGGKQTKQGAKPRRRSAPRRDPRLENIAAKLHAWTRGQVLDEEAEMTGSTTATTTGSTAANPPTLFVHNFSIQALPTSRHTLASQIVRKRIFGGQFLKRQLCDDMTTTVPIPEDVLEPYLAKRLKKCSSS